MKDLKYYFRHHHEDPKEYDKRCNDKRCPLGCADGAAEDRLETYYKGDLDEVEEAAMLINSAEPINFKSCHPIWQKYYITIDPPSLDSSGRYIAIGSVAAFTNIAVLSFGFYLIHQLTKDKGIQTDLKTVNDPKSWAAKLLARIYKCMGIAVCMKKCVYMNKYLMIFLPLLLQVTDSLLDALYFIKLKTGYRIINVPPTVHVIQGLLLFTCKSTNNCSSKLELRTIHRIRTKSISACLKDTITVYLIHRSYKVDYKNGRIAADKQVALKYYIYLTAFTLEDFGQAFLQYYYYERFQTKLNILTIFNAFFKLLMAFKSFVDLAIYPVDSDEKQGQYE